jgi:hypothetical protein
MKMKWILFLMSVGLCAGCGDDKVASVVTGSEENALDECTDPPIIDHDEIDDAQQSNADVQILAYVYTDDGCEVEIMTVELHYRQETATEWNKITMTRGQEADEWKANILAQELNSAKIFYYLRAVDKAGQVSILPEDADTSLMRAFYFGVSTS